ncbi:MAG TPA: glycosyltransferase family 2 protein [Candidatus Saccharimonadales bacterium]|nr:glycosyltransferase family 2 protein [Candidatus Saccharimonadales bacterium]
MSRDQMRRSAAQLMSRGQVALGLILMLLAAAQAKVFGPLALLKTVSAAIITFYVVFLAFKFVVSAAGNRAQSYFDWLDSLPLLKDHQLDNYCVLVPVRKEGQLVMKLLVEELCKLDYPVKKLKIMLLLEDPADDPITHDALRHINLPSRFEVKVTPFFQPKTKPKACSWAWQYVPDDFDFATIYDGEDRPEREQLRKAATAFYHLERKGKKVGCLQSELAFWNPRSSWVSTFMWAEYSVHFRKMLRGMAHLRLIPPLGGTSNHFRVQALREVAANNGVRTYTDKDGNTVHVTGPWDEWNMTEDADLAMRLYMAGWIIMMLHSVTFEEAPDSLITAKNQRTRWLLGYSQTCLVWSRKWWEVVRKVGFIRWFCFELMMGGTHLSLLLNPLTWASTALYVVARFTGNVGITEFMEQLFPAPVYYAGMAVAIFGNAILWYQKITVPVMRQNESEVNAFVEDNRFAVYQAIEEHGLTIRLVFTPVWWAFTCISAYRALRKLLFDRKTWEKTTHGDNMDAEATMAH